MLSVPEASEAQSHHPAGWPNRHRSQRVAKDEATALDQGIEKNYKAALISTHLGKQHIDYGAKNGVLTLTGSVHSTAQRNLGTL